MSFSTLSVVRWYWGLELSFIGCFFQHFSSSLLFCASGFPGIQVRALVVRILSVVVVQLVTHVCIFVLMTLKLTQPVVFCS